MLRGLRDAGYDVRAIVEEDAGAEDSFVLAKARLEKRVLLTNDKDFAELVFRRKSASHGVLLLRLRDWNAEQKRRRLLEVLDGLPSLDHTLLVVRPRNIRRRTMIDRS